MSNYDCPNEFCINFSEYEFCKCKKASSYSGRSKASMNATVVQECRAYRKRMDYEAKLSKTLDWI